MRGRPCHVFSALFAATMLLSCQHGRIQEVQQREQTEFSRNLFAPLVSGEEALLRNLRADDAPSRVFSLSHAGARPLLSVSPNHFWDEDKAVFVLAAETGGAAAWRYLNPRDFSLAPLEARDQPGDLAFTAPASFSLFRAAAVKGQGSTNPLDLEIFRYDFKLGPQGPEYLNCARITDEPGADLLPMPYPAERQVLYLHARPGANRELRCTSWEGGVSLPLLRREKLDFRYPRQEQDGRLVFAANPEGHFQLYQITDIRAALNRLVPRGGYLKVDEAALSDAFQPFQYAPSEQKDAPRCFIASMGEGGRIQPRVVQLPAALGLKEVLSLVMAHNPSVNQQRARLAAALARVDEPRLYNWPLVNLGLDFEDALNLLFDLPQIATGDTLSRQFSRGLAGFVLPLFDYRQNAALSEETRHRAAVEASGVENEINERLADAAEAFFEARYFQRQLALDQELIGLSEERRAHFAARRTLGESIPLQTMAVDQVLEGLNSEAKFHQDRLDFLLARLRDLCGLPRAAAIVLAEEAYDFETYQIPRLEAMQDIALLNHPRIAMLRDEIAAASFSKDAGHPINTSGVLTAGYELGFRDFDRVVTESTGTATFERSVPDSRRDEIGTIGVSAQVPLAGRKARRTHEESWDARIEALLFAEKQESQNISTGMHEAYMDFVAAQRDYQAKSSTESYYLEKVRVARVQIDGGISDLSAPVEPDGVNALSALTAREEYLNALGRRAVVEKDLGLRYVKLWREMGMAAKLTEADTVWAVGVRSTKPTSTWIWRTRDMLEDEAAMGVCVETLRRAGITRVYVYLYSDSLLLEEPRMEQRLLRFMNGCAEGGIAVWGLLGEPEWLQSDEGPKALERGISRMTAFNTRQKSFEPGFQGLKLDIEPHALPAWQEVPAGREALTAAYLNIIRAARAALPKETPLWADIPVQFLREENEALRRSLEGAVAGLTVMCYFNNENAIRKWADIAFQECARPVEIAVELNATAPANDSLAAWPRERVEALSESLRNTARARQNFHGLAYHDIDGVSRLWHAEVTRAY